MENQNPLVRSFTTSSAADSLSRPRSSTNSVAGRLPPWFHEMAWLTPTMSSGSASRLWVSASMMLDCSKQSRAFSKWPVGLLRV